MTRPNDKAQSSARRNKSALPEKDERLTRRVLGKGNYTRLDNALLDELLPVMGLAECKVVIAAIRKIEGWNKTEDAISLTQFQESTGLSVYSVREGIAAAVARGVLIEVAPATRTRAAIYSLAYPALADEQPAAPRPQRMTHDETVAALTECVFDNGTALDERGRVITAQRIGRVAKELRKLLPDCTPEEIRESAAWYVQYDGSYLQAFDESGNVCELPHTARKIAEVVKGYRAAPYADEQPAPATAATIASEQQSPAIQRPTAADTPNSEQPPVSAGVYQLWRNGTHERVPDKAVATLAQDFQAWCEKHKPEVPITEATFNQLRDEFSQRHYTYYSPPDEQPAPLDTTSMYRAIRKQTSLDDSYISEHIPEFIAWCEKHKPETTITRENVSRLWHDFFDEIIPF